VSVRRESCASTITLPWSAISAMCEPLRMRCHVAPASRVRNVECASASFSARSYQGPTLPTATAKPGARAVEWNEPIERCGRDDDLPSTLKLRKQPTRPSGATSCEHAIGWPRSSSTRFDRIGAHEPPLSDDITVMTRASNALFGTRFWLAK
jgi:hypothetical protein